MQRWIECCWLALSCALACSQEHAQAPAAEAPSSPPVRLALPGPPSVPDTPAQSRARARMVHEQIEARGVRDRRVLDAMQTVPRHMFVPARERDHAYEDHALPIEAEQTISQPYIVALMTELARIAPGQKVLEVGTGSGYQAAVLATLGARVYSVEIVPVLARTARERLRAFGYPVQVRQGDGYDGWPDAAPFDAIVVTAAAPSVPAPLREQLAIGGRLVIPVGENYQDLLVITRTEHGYEQTHVLPVQFVPMTGEVQRRSRKSSAPASP